MGVPMGPYLRPSHPGRAAPSRECVHSRNGARWLACVLACVPICLFCVEPRDHGRAITLTPLCVPALDSCSVIHDPREAVSLARTVVEPYCWSPDA